METIKCNTFSAKIYLAGPVSQAEQLIREEMLQGGCVNIYKTKYIYTGGEEEGYVVEFINYPRFPSSIENIKEKALSLAYKLMIGTHQSSYTVVFNDESVFVSRRDELS